MSEIRPKVSVMVVTFNHGEWLRECLDSIVSQETAFPFEVIVGDDCSTDGITPLILREFADRYPDLIVPVFREKNLGVTENWFDVVRRTKGEYIAHMDGDDRMLPGKLQKQVDFLDQNQGCAVVGHDLRIFDGTSGQTIADSFATVKIPTIADINFLVSHLTYFGHGSKMFRRSAMISWHRDRPTIDFFLHIEHATSGSIGYMDEVLGEYRKSSGSASDNHSPFWQSLIGGYQDAFERALELGADRDAVTRGRLLFNYSVAYRYLLTKDRPNFRKYITLDQNSYRHAIWQHRLFNALQEVPGLVLLIIQSKKAINTYLFRRRVAG